MSSVPVLPFPHSILLNNGTTRNNCDHNIKSVLKVNQPGVFWTYGKWGLVAAAIGYCFYFDRKRRSAPSFKEAHRSKRKAEQLAARKAQETELAAKKNAAAIMKKAAATVGGGGRPKQPKKAPREAILMQAQQFAKQGLQMINEAGKDTMKINQGLQIILESVNVFNMLEDPQGLVTWHVKQETSWRTRSSNAREVTGGQHRLA